MMNFPSQDNYFQIEAPEAETAQALLHILTEVLNDHFCYSVEPLTDFISYQDDERIINLPFNLRKNLNLQDFLQILCYNINNHLNYEIDALWATTYTINIQINQNQFQLSNDNGVLILK